MSVAFNLQEAEICNRRYGHDLGPLAFIHPGKWSQCKWCGTWVRTLSTTEERIVEPPVEERAPARVA